MLSKAQSLLQDFEIFWKKCNPKDNDDAKFILSAIVENKKNSHKQYLRSYYLMLIFLGIFYFLDSKIASTNKPLVFFSIEIDNISYVQWVIQLLVSFFYYQGAIAFLQERNYVCALRQYFKQHIPEINESKLSELIINDSFLGFEYFQIHKYKNKISQSFIVFILFIFLVIPCWILGYMLYTNILLWGSIESTFFKVSICILTTIFFIRSLMVIIDDFKNP